MSSRTIIVLALALLFGISAAMGLNVYINRQQGPPPDTASVVIIADKEVSRGRTLSADQLALKPWAKEFIPTGALLKIEDAVGRVASTPFLKDEIVVESRLAAKNAARGMSALVPKGMRAFTIQTPHVATGVGGFIQPGNKVDVLLTVIPTGTDDVTGGGSTTTLLQNIEVMAVDQSLEPSAENKVDPKSLRSVTLIVTPDQATKLGLGQKKGDLYLSLRNAEDKDEAKTRPALLRDLRFSQEKPWTEGVKDLFDAFKKTAPQPGPAKAVIGTPSPEGGAPRPLQIRTLRGRENGLVTVENQ